jgi:hypothetical protein
MDYTLFEATLFDTLSSSPEKLEKFQSNLKVIVEMYGQEALLRCVCTFANDRLKKWYLKNY